VAYLEKQQSSTTNEGLLDQIHTFFDDMNHDIQEVCCRVPSWHVLSARVYL